MNSYNVFVSRTAENDLMDIIRYIRSQLLAPITADNMLELLNDSMQGLAEFPKKHPLVKDERLASLGYRILRVKNYIVFFSVDDEKKEVNIERILYARRDWLSIL